AARTFWDVPVGVDVLPAPGVSVLIAAIPGLAPRDTVRIAAPTYGEHAEAFRAAGWRVVTEGPALAQVAVHPNNPDGRLWSREGLLDTHRGLTVIDESFCDCDPGQSLADLAARPGVVVLKGLGKFWGLGGLRLGFALGRRVTLDRLRARIGPWAVSGPALALGAQALGDRAWAADAQARLSKESALLDTKLTEFGARLVGGTKLFRTYAHDDAPALADRLARCHILVRVFTYNRRWLRFGLPGHETDWARLAQGLEA
ncbi:MAG: aminotransferase class I/II-fold pyridoxal phosphate-dependent enzyme, partial [Pseudomonadota bacterium]